VTAPGHGGDAVSGGGTTALRGALLVGVAVVLGVILLGRGLDSGVVPSSSNGDDAAGADGGDGEGGDGGTTASTTTTTSLPPPRNPAEVKVWAINGSGLSGVAGAATDKAVAAGYATASASDAPEGQDVPATVIYYLEGFQSDAIAVATVIGVAPTAQNVQPLPQPLPPAIPSGDLQGSNVIVVLGPDAPPAG
jgi:LytR cell envelope-related transcriptional attenuator